MDMARNLTEVGESYFESRYTDRFNKAFSGIESAIAGRATEVLALRYAMVLGQHVMFYGPHGTAKSYLANDVFRRVKDSNVFSLQMRKEMGVDYVFGPMDINQYKEKAIVRHNTKHMLPECDFAFLDEFFDANDSVLRGLLECLFERKFMGRNIPLRTVIATTNFYEEDAKKEAVIDRFMFRVKVEPLSRRADKRKMLMVYQKSAKDAEKVFDIGMLDEYETAIKCVSLDSILIKALFDIVDAYSGNIGKTYPVSDRRLCWCVDMLKASALLEGRSKVTEEDFKALYFVLGVAKTQRHDESFFAAFSKVFGEVEQEVSSTNLVEEFMTNTQSCSSKAEEVRNEILTAFRAVKTNVPNVEVSPTFEMVTADKRAPSFELMFGNVSYVPEDGKRELSKTYHALYRKLIEATSGDHIKGISYSSEPDNLSYSTARKMCHAIAALLGADLQSKV